MSLQGIFDPIVNAYFKKKYGKKPLFGFYNMQEMHEWSQEDEAFHLVEGKTYSLQLDDETVEMVCKKEVYSAYGGKQFTYLYLGNLHYEVDDKPDTGEQFVFFEVFEGGEYQCHLYRANPIGENSYKTFLVYDGTVTNNGGNIVNPDKSGVIVTDLNEMYYSNGESVFFKLADESFRVDPNLPIPLNRIKCANYALNPFYAWGEREYYLDAKNQIKNPCYFEENGFTEDNMVYEDGYETAYVDGGDAGGEFFVRVTADEAIVFEQAKLPKGLYAVCMYSSFYPASIEILPPTD